MELGHMRTTTCAAWPVTVERPSMAGRQSLVGRRLAHAAPLCGGAGCQGVPSEISEHEAISLHGPHSWVARFWVAPCTQPTCNAHGRRHRYTVRDVDSVVRKACGGERLCVVQVYRIPSCSARGGRLCVRQACEYTVEPGLLSPYRPGAGAALQSLHNLPLYSIAHAYMAAQSSQHKAARSKSRCIGTMTFMRHRGRPGALSARMQTGPIRLQFHAAPQHCPQYKVR